MARQRLLESTIVTTPDRAEVSSRVLTVPNILSFFRLLMVPVFLYLILTGYDLLALVVLVVSTATDFFDGLIARRFGQISRLGQLLDPAADRLFIFVTLVGLAVRGILPWWLVAAIIGRDALLLLLGVVLANVGYGPLPVHHPARRQRSACSGGCRSLCSATPSPRSPWSPIQLDGPSRCGVRSSTGGLAASTRGRRSRSCEKTG